MWTRLDSVAETTAGGETELLAGTDRLEEQLGGLSVSISGEAFFQTNTEMAERLYALAIEYAQLGGFDRLYDLYCGIGTIGLLMAPRVAELWGLEIVEDAISDAIANARRNEVDNANFFAGDVRLALRELVEKAGRPDVLVVDPAPRGPLAEGRAPHHRGRAQAHRLRLVQPHDAGAQRGTAGAGGIRADEGAARRHVPADAAHRVRRGTRAPQLTSA